MKYLLIIILIIVLVLIGILFFVNKNKKTENTQKEIVEPKNEIPKQASETINSDTTVLYNIDPVSSTVKWEGKKTLITDWIDQGSISLKSGKVNINNGNLDLGEIVIDMTTLTSNKTGAGGGEDKLTTHLKSTDFFDVENYPTANFKLISAEKSTETSYNISGEITIKGITQNIRFPVDVYFKDNQLIIEGKMNIDRTKFDIKYGSGNFFNDLGNNVIDDNFVLDFKLIGTK